MIKTPSPWSRIPEAACKKTELQQTAEYSFAKYFYLIQQHNYRETFRPESFVIISSQHRSKEIKMRN